MKPETKIITGIILIALLAVLLGMYLYGKNNPNETDSLNNSIADKTLLIREDSQQIGPKDAKVTLVEFADLECEACGAAHPILQKVLKEYEGKVAFVFRHFPNHFNSILAVKAVEAAGEQGKFWEMHDKLFEKQLEWGEKKVPQTTLFTKYAEEIGLNIPSFTASLQTNTYDAKITRDRDDAKALGVNATPTFFLNGKKYVGVPSYEKFKEMIDKELSI